MVNLPIEIKVLLSKFKFSNPNWNFIIRIKILQSKLKSCSQSKLKFLTNKSFIKSKITFVKSKLKFYQSKLKLNQIEIIVYNSFKIEI